MKFALEMPDGSIQIMETVGDIHPLVCIEKWHPKLPRPVKVRLAKDGEVSSHREQKKSWFRK